MCLVCACGCGQPDSDHGNPANITLSDLQAAADAQGITPEQAAANIVLTLANLGAGDDATDAAVKSLDTAAIRVVKATDERRYTLGLGYPAMRADKEVAADGFRDFVSESVLQDTAWTWMQKYRNVGLHHAEGTDYSGEVVESYLYRGPDWEVVSPVDGKTYVIKAGDWLVGTVWSEAAWPLVKRRLVNGYSPQGGARRAIPSPERLAELRS